MIKILLIWFGVPAMVCSIIMAALSDVGWQSVAIIFNGLFALITAVMVMIFNRDKKKTDGEVKVAIAETKVEIKELHKTVNSNQDKLVTATLKAGFDRGTIEEKEARSVKDADFEKGRKSGQEQQKKDDDLLKQQPPGTSL